MKLPAIHGIIDRRILINFRVDPLVLAKQVPHPFRVQLAHGYGIAGVCLIRLKQMRPRFVPGWLGFSSENAAHRIAVEWDEHDDRKTGVYIPRRDSSSLFNRMVGGRLFPGLHHAADFTVEETATTFHIQINSKDGKVRLRVRAGLADRLNHDSIFTDLREASDFFERGAVGYSPSTQARVYDSLELASENWSVQPLRVDTVESSFFADTTAFPESSVQFDNALLMREVRHEWCTHKQLCCHD